MEASVEVPDAQSDSEGRRIKRVGTARGCSNILSVLDFDTSAPQSTDPPIYQFLSRLLIRKGFSYSGCIKSWDLSWNLPFIRCAN